MSKDLLTLDAMAGIIATVAMDCPGHDKALLKLHELIGKYGALTLADWNEVRRYIYK